MTEHVHEWCWAPWWEDGPAGRKHFLCEFEGCKETRSLIAAERSLNATERLSAKRARNAGVWIHIAFDDERDNLKAAQAYQDALLAYASALERQTLSTVVANEGAENKDR